MRSILDPAGQCWHHCNIRRRQSRRICRGADC